MTKNGPSAVSLALDKLHIQYPNVKPRSCPHTPSTISSILCKVQSIIGYRLQNPRKYLPTLWLALQSSRQTWALRQGGNKGYLPSERDEEGNRNLAHLGDKVHDFLLTTSIYGPTKSVNEMHKYKSALSTNAYFTEVGFRCGLVEYIQVADTNQLHEKFVADAMEAIMAVCWQDGGLRAVGKMLIQLDMVNGLTLNLEGLESYEGESEFEGFVLV